MVIRIDNDKVGRIADYYGQDSRLRQLAEECSELSVESLHYIRERGATERISEEMMDVLIMIQQIIYLLGDDVEKLAKYADFKLDRQLGRIDSWVEQKESRSRYILPCFTIMIKKVSVLSLKINICFSERVILYDKNIRL